MSDKGTFSFKLSKFRVDRILNIKSLVCILNGIAVWIFLRLSKLNIFLVAVFLFLMIKCISVQLKKMCMFIKDTNINDQCSKYTIQLYFGDIVGLVSGHHNNTDIAIKWVVIFLLVEGLPSVCKNCKTHGGQ